MFVAGTGDTVGEQDIAVVAGDAWVGGEHCGPERV
jgi:hypothetical protein